MTLNGRTKFPTRRTYVVKVHGDAQPDTISGRLENLITGQQREFASGHELLDSIASDLGTSADEPSVGNTNGGKE